jgi:hypothetical protein
MSEPRKLLPSRGPSYRPKRVEMVSRPFYERYRLSATHPLSFENWKVVIRAFNQKVVDEVIGNRNGVSLPHQLGTLLVASVEPSTKPWRTAINYGMKHTDVEVQLPNIGTGGFQCKIIYSSFDVKYLQEERQLWAFRGCRTFKRSVSKAYLVDWEKYIYLSKTGKISREYLAYSHEKGTSKIDKEKYDPLEA